MTKHSLRNDIHAVRYDKRYSLDAEHTANRRQKAVPHTERGILNFACYIIDVG
jgi:hypothetical protein